MSLNYEPDYDAVPDLQWKAVYLSTRDASSKVPINFITHPGVSLTQACFSDQVYDDIPAQTCISNLLALQFRRLVIDLYWDTINRQFGLCPVELPPLAGNATSGISVDTSALNSLTATTSSSTLLLDVDGPSLMRRQSVAANTSTTVESTTSPSNGTTRPSSMPTAIPTSTGVDGSTLLELGDYRCSLDLTLESIISLYDSYLKNTSDTVSVRLAFLDINLHAASPFVAPSDPAPSTTGQHLPRHDELIGVQLETAFPRSLFTPEMLRIDRADLGGSWSRNSFSLDTATAYFQTSTDPDGERQTFDGWPGESWLLLTDNRRLLVSWSQIDPQMEGYDFRSDSERVFSAGYIGSNSSVAINDDSNLESACFYQPQVFSVPQVNSSWAVAVFDEPTTKPISGIINNMTGCGVSPVLNFPLTGPATLDNLEPYRDFARAAVFGWASGEPKNISAPGDDAEGSDDEYRCALMDSTTGYGGHWRVGNCQQRHRVACRVSDQPYHWRLSSSDVPFGSALEACPNNTKFDLPRTGLENTYLYQRILNDSRNAEEKEAKSMVDGIWIDFNSLQLPDCWTSGGPNATCPYADNADEARQRNVLIPTIAALIVLILTVLTLLVKCNENRRNSRTRRRGDNGWDYEGVPS